MKAITVAAGRLITLSKPFDTRAKCLNIFYALLFGLGSLMFIIPVFEQGIPYTFPTLFATAFIVVALVAAYRFLNKALESETVLITHEKLTISKKGFLATKLREFDIKCIANLRHLQKPELTKHPLAGETYDYLGFQTEQLVINEMHGDDRVAFDYNGSLITFGDNIYSWQFEELKEVMEREAGRSLSQALSVEG